MSAPGSLVLAGLGSSSAWRLLFPAGGEMSSTCLVDLSEDVASARASSGGWTQLNKPPVSAQKWGR